MFTIFFVQGHQQFTSISCFSEVQGKYILRWDCHEKRKILKDRYFHQMNNKNTLRNEDYCATCRTLGLISVVMFLFYVGCYFHRLSKPVFFFQSKKTIPLLKKKEKRRQSSLSCTHKKWIMSQEGKGSRVPTPRHVMFVFRERG